MQFKDSTLKKVVMIPIETSVGLKLVDPVTKATQLFSFQNEQIRMDWSLYLQTVQQSAQSNLSFTVTSQQFSKLTLNGDKELLSKIYSYSIGKYIFNRGTFLQMVRTIKKDDEYELKVVVDTSNGKQYYEKVLIGRPQQREDLFSSSHLTIEEESIIPEEIQIILDLHRTFTPHLLNVESIFFDGTNYSFIYQRNKDIIRLIQYHQSSLQENQYLLVHVARQLLQLLMVLEDKQIVFPSIHQKTVYINPKTHDIIILNYYYQAFYSKNIKQRRSGVNFGYTPPEYFNVEKKITSKANIYQVGVLLFQLLIGHSPYGKGQAEIVKNTLKSTPDLSPLKNNTKPIANLIKLLLEQDCNKRLSVRQLIQHFVFRPQSIEKISKLSIQQKQMENLLDQSIDEFKHFNKISNIQQVKSQGGCQRKNN